MYVQTLITYLSELGHELIVVLPCDGRTRNEFASVLEPLSHIARYEFAIPTIANERLHTLRHVTALVAAVRKHAPSLVIIPTAGYLALWCICLWCLLWSPQFWSTKLHVNMIVLPFGYPITSIRDVIKRLAYVVLLASAPTKRTTTIDAINLRSSWYITRKLTRLRYAPEPIPIQATLSKHAARQALKLPTEAFLLGVVGMIDCRKEIELLLAAAQHPEWPPSVSVVLAGPIATASRQAILQSGLGERLIVHDRFLPETDIMRYIKALDCVWLVYRDHQGPSATLVKALVLGTQVVAQEEGWIGATAKSAECKSIIRARSPKAIVQSISALLGSGGMAPHAGLIAKHLPSEFAAVVSGVVSNADGGASLSAADSGALCI